MTTDKVADSNSANQWTLKRSLPWLLLIGGLIGVLASLFLSIEVFSRLKNPAYVPICNLNPILSCTSVADSSQAQAFGFPNYFIGIAGYSALAVVGAGLLAGAKFKRWFWRSLQVGMLFAFGFISWLQFQSIYRIGALCIFCMVAWAVTGPIFWYLTLYNLRERHIRIPKKLSGLTEFAARNHGNILIVWFLLIAGLVLKRFWYYFSSLF